MQKFAAIVAKSSLSEAKMAQLWRSAPAYRDRVEDRVRPRIPMTMQSRKARLHRFTEARDREVLQDAGEAMAETTKARAERAFATHCTVRDRLFEGDFDLMAKRIKARRKAEGQDE